MCTGVELAAVVLSLRSAGFFFARLARGSQLLVFAAGLPPVLLLFAVTRSC